MEELNNGTLNGQEQPETQETQEQQPEYYIDDNGNLAGDFSDFETGNETQEGGTDEQTETGEESTENENKNYTKEEIENLGIDKLDPNKIPPELLPFYKSMQADYTRKTQAVAQERKIVEKVLDKALSHPELAKDFISDQEMVAAAQQHPELAQKLQVVSQMAQPEQSQSKLDMIVNGAKQEVERELGEPFDEFDPKHITAFNLKVQEINQHLTRQQETQQKLMSIQSSEPRFAEVDAYAESKLAQMPYAEAKKIELALQNGDIDTVLNFWNECRKEWYNNNVAAGNQDTQPAKTNPPRVEQSGQGETNIQPKFSPSAFANASSEERNQILAKLGLLD